jgi:hypothetical protein
MGWVARVVVIGEERIKGLRFIDISMGRCTVASRDVRMGGLRMTWFHWVDGGEDRQWQYGGRLLVSNGLGVGGDAERIIRR